MGDRAHKVSAPSPPSARTLTATARASVPSPAGCGRWWGWLDRSLGLNALHHLAASSIVETGLACGGGSAQVHGDVMRGHSMIRAFFETLPHAVTKNYRNLLPQHLHQRKIFATYTTTLALALVTK
jgi:hypothetical protein